VTKQNHNVAFSMTLPTTSLV